MIALALGLGCQRFDPIGTLRPNEHFPLGGQMLSIALAREYRLKDVSVDALFNPVPDTKWITQRSWVEREQDAGLECTILLGAKSADPQALSDQLFLDRWRDSQSDHAELELNGQHWKRLSRYSFEPMNHISAEREPEDKHLLLYDPRRIDPIAHVRTGMVRCMVQDTWMTEVKDGQVLIIDFEIYHGKNRGEDALTLSKRTTVQIEKVIESVRLE